MRGSWTERVIAELVACKEARLSFDVAWDMAMRRHPPRDHDHGPRVLSLLPGDPESLVDFTRRVTSDAWHGRKPALRNVGGLRALLDSDESVAGRA